MEDQTPKKKSIWSKIGNVVSSPSTAFSDATKHSPLITIFAIMLIVQPLIQTGIELVKEVASVRHDLDPANRPITKAELEIINQKIDFNNQLILSGIRAEVKRNGVVKPHAIPDSADYTGLQSKLDVVQKKLDLDFKQHPLKK